MALAIEQVPGVENPELIGKGGFGDVFVCDQPALGRKVAVKILYLRPDDETARVFRNEALVLGRLSTHPNIVTLYSADLTAEGYPYMVMEFASFGSMQRQLKDSDTIWWQHAVEVGVAMCAALQAAHRMLIHHRDVKPDNIFRSDHGVPLLGDFGIATIASHSKTESRTITATLAHASPEQIAGQNLDHRTDIYSLGSTLYHLLKGRPAHVTSDDDGIPAIMNRVLNVEPDPLDGIPDHIQDSILWAMAKDREARPTLDQLRDSLTSEFDTTARPSLEPDRPEVIRVKTIDPVDAHATPIDSFTLRSDVMNARSSAADGTASQIPSQIEMTPRPQEGRTPRRGHRGLLVFAVALAVLVSIGLTLIPRTNGTSDPPESTPATAAVPATTMTIEAEPPPETTPCEFDASLSAENEACVAPPTRDAATARAQLEEFYSLIKTRDYETAYRLQTPEYSDPEAEFEEFWGVGVASFDVIIRSCEIVNDGLAECNIELEITYSQADRNSESQRGNCFAETAVVTLVHDGTRFLLDAYSRESAECKSDG